MKGQLPLRASGLSWETWVALMPLWNSSFNKEGESVEGKEWQQRQPEGPVWRGYKFTGEGRQALMGKTDYPPMRKWSELRRPVLLCHQGWHVNTPDGLAEFVGAELWEVEVRGMMVQGSGSWSRKRAYEQIRFLRRVENWDRGALRQFATELADESHDSYARDQIWERLEAEEVVPDVLSDACRVILDTMETDELRRWSRWIIDRLDLKYDSEMTEFMVQVDLQVQGVTATRSLRVRADSPASALSIVGSRLADVELPRSSA